MPLSPAGLDALHDRMARHVETGALPGLVTLVAAGDDAHVDVIGTPSFADPSPMERNAIFRIASLTKPVVAATALTLVDEGVLRLDQPVDGLLPELAGRRVLRAIDAELDDTVPARRSITVDDLLTYRMGFGSVMAPPDTYPIQRAEAAAGLQSIGGPPWPPGPHDPDSWIAALGALPLMDQPGEQWRYNSSGQVLGVLVARAAGTDLASAVGDRILGPLGMTDTGFSVPGASLDRLTTFYVPDDDAGAPRCSTIPPTAGGPRRPGCPTAVAGSSPPSTTTGRSSRCSSAAARSATLASSRRMQWRGMTTNQLTSAQRAGNAPFLGEHDGWGFGMAAPRQKRPGSPCRVATAGRAARERRGGRTPNAA